MPTYYSASLGSISARLVSVSDLEGTYNNGNAGEGATLTAPGNGALSIDSVSAAAGDIVLLTNNTEALENGPYLVVDAGSGSTPWVLQRALFFNNPSSLVAGGTFIPIGAGTIGAGQIWVLIEPLPVTIGSDSITFKQT